MQLFTSPLLQGVRHGFTGRQGGVSSGAFASLNLNRSTGDSRASIARNRELLLGHLHVATDQLALLSQVHGLDTVRARAGEPLQEADAQHTDDPGVLLAVTWADCLPLLFHDPVSGAVAAAHCGWRGSLGGLAGRVVAELQHTYGTEPDRLRVAVGPGICQDCYQVGPELARKFSEAGWGADVLRPDPSRPGHVRLDLAEVNRQVLEAAGVRADNTDFTGLCTSCRPDDFFSHRRDAGHTGRHWAVIQAVSDATSY